MTSLSYSREELPVECPECDCLLTKGQILSRDTYTETALYPCPICRETFKVLVTED